MNRNTIRASLTTLLFLVGISTNLVAQDYPTKPVRIVAPYSAGSGPDVVARVIADRLGKMWNQQVLIENRSGANGIIAIGAIKKSPLDGHNLIFADDSMLTVNPHLYANVPYAPETDLTPITLVMNTPFYLMVAASGPIKSVKELIAYARDNPGKLVRQR